MILRRVFPSQSATIIFNFSTIRSLSEAISKISWPWSIKWPPLRLWIDSALPHYKPLLYSLAFRKENLWDRLQQQKKLQLCRQRKRMLKSSPQRQYWPNHSYFSHRSSSLPRNKLIKNNDVTVEKESSCLTTFFKLHNWSRDRTHIRSLELCCKWTTDYRVWSLSYHN